MHKALLCTILLSSALFSNEETAPTNCELEITAPWCSEIVLLDDESSAISTSDQKGLITIGVDVPGGNAKLEIELAQYLNCPITSKSILEIKDAIRSYFRRHNQPFIAISIPDQKISQGTLQLVIQMSCLSELNVVGNKWTPSSWLENYMGNTPGETLDELSLRRDLEFMNRNFFRHVSVILSPGQMTNTTDITLSVKERNRVRLYAGADNTGVPTTGRQRLYGGFNWGKAFGLDHILSYQYTSSYNFNEFQAHTVQYLALLSWKHLLNVYGGFSSVHANLPFPTMKSTGFSGQASLRYTVPLPPGRAFTHDCSLVFDFKRTNNNLEFSDLFPRFGKNVNLTQLAGEYRFEKGFRPVLINFNTQIFYSPGDLFADETNADYNSLRPGAKSEYVYGKGALNFLFYLPKKWYFNCLTRVQLSSQNLLPSEQFGIGGADTVRGYDERQLNMDRAVIVNWELRTPYLPLFQNINKRKISDAIQFLGFVDYGYGKDHNAIVGEPNPEYLLSAGPGLRYTLDPYIPVRLDWGFKLHNEPEFTGGSSMVQFGSTLSY